ncbi:MAG: CHAD domain-containing protein [Alphaproteobacteria bacterium]|nr:CHAD domain-containing protein [Alphaproteobacteria bacterium]
MSPADHETDKSDLFVPWHKSVTDSFAQAIKTLQDETLEVWQRVHATRRCAKRARALLKLAPLQLQDGSQRLRTELRQIRKSIGPARDARVAYDLLAAQLSTKDIDSNTAPQLLVNLQRICDDIEAHTKAQIFPKAIQQLRTLLKTAKLWHAEGMLPALLVDQIRSGYKQARKNRPRRSNALDLAKLHAFRSSLVDHYYQLDFLPHEDSKKIDKRKTRLKELRTELGLYLDHHQLETLTKYHLTQHWTEAEPDKSQHQSKIEARFIKDARELFDLSPDEVMKSLTQ